MTPALLERTRQTFPRWRFSQGWHDRAGAGGHAAWPGVSRRGGAGERQDVSVGRPAHTVEVKVVDAKGNEVPRGTVGEIIVRGPNVMLGYWNQPQATAEAIRNGWMHTGDGGHMDKDGFCSWSTA
jgi:long-chain acyl-CoA synthetase